jgi:alpha-methylacyl-CoA racemase
MSAHLGGAAVGGAAAAPAATGPGAAGPLQGMRVIELAGIGPGPFAAMLLADLGAEVIRVERPRGSGSMIPPQLDAVRRSRKSVMLDLRRPAGAGALLQLVEKADVLIEGYRPGVTERLGVGPAECLAHNPRLVYGRITGWGQDGPLAAAAGHDICYLAITGALHAIGRSHERPVVPANFLGDYAGGSLYLVVGVLAALFEVGRSGQGQVVDAAIVDGAASLTTVLHGLMSAGLWRDQRGVNPSDTGRPWYDVYETSDGRYVAVGPVEPKFYAAFMALLGLDPDEQRREDPGTWPAIRLEIAGAIAQRSREEWTRIFEDTDACAAPVLSLTEASRHPHLVGRRTFVAVNGVPQPGPAPRFSRTPPSPPRPPAEPGADTRETLLALGFPDVDALIESGAAIQA